MGHNHEQQSIASSFAVNGQKEKIANEMQNTSFLLMHGLLLGALQTMGEFVPQLHATLPFNGPHDSADHWPVDLALTSSGTTRALYQASLHLPQLRFCFAFLFYNTM